MPVLLMLFPLPFLVVALRGVCVAWRAAILGAVVIWGTLLVVMTEGLTAFKAFAVLPVAGAWGVITLLSAAAALLVTWRRVPETQRLLPPPRPRRVIGKSARWIGIGVDALCVTPLVLGILAIIVLTFVTAVYSPPNNWDSMTYHMARVEHWIQNRSIDFYPTHIPRQNHMPPLSEWTIAHVQLLADGERFANTIQWAAMVLSVIGVSLIARHLGATWRGQVLASLAAATVPMGILQSSTTQNDYACAAGIVCCVGLCLELFARPVAQTRWTTRVTLTLLVGLAGGLALLTKGTAYVFLPGFGVLLAAIGLIRWKRAAILPLLAIIVLAPLPSAGFYVRNYLACGHPLGPGTEPAPNNQIYTNERHNPGAIYANLVRGLAVQFALPDTSNLTGVVTPPDEEELWYSNRSLGKLSADWGVGTSKQARNEQLALDIAEQLRQHGVDPKPLGDLSRRLRLDQSSDDRNTPLRESVRAHLARFGIDADDPKTNWASIPYTIWPSWNHEDGAGSPLTVLLLAFALVTLWLYLPRWPGGRRGRGRAVGYFLAVAAGFVMFCAVFKWQPWHTRLELPLLVISAPLIGVALGAWPRLVSYPIAAVLLIATAPYLFNSATRPLVGERSILTRDRDGTRFNIIPPHRGERFKELAATLRAQDKTNIGIVCGNDGFEYPLICLFGDDRRRFRFEHVGVTNYTSGLSNREPFKSFKPDWIVNLEGEMQLERVNETSR